MATPTGHPIIADTSRRRRRPHITCPHAGRVRVAVVTESFLPSANGVTTSVCRVLDHLWRRGHEALVVCPGPAPASYAGFDVRELTSLVYRQFPIALPTGHLQQVLADFNADVVHAASPFVLGAAGLAAARRLDVPSIAVYQTDVAGYPRRHHLRVAAGPAWRWIRKVHAMADLTLAPSTASLEDLRAHGVRNLAIWGRGVDSAGFHPRWRAEPRGRELRRLLAPHGQVLVGYVGRLAPEKRVERLAALAGLPGVRLVVVGDGPSRAFVQRRLTADGADVVMLGRQAGTEETFGQTLQEAMASRVPVVAPASGGPLDIVRPGVTGLLFDPDDDTAMREAVASLVAEPGLGHRMGEAGRRAVLNRSWHGIGDELVGYYRSVQPARLSSLVPAGVRPE